MATATISSKFQVIIPKEVREKLHLKSGQKMTVIAKGRIVYLIPERPLGPLKGFIKGLPTGDIREEKDRKIITLHRHP